MKIIKSDVHIVKSNKNIIIHLFNFELVLD